ncbi:hypothetical protein DH2020_025954 [Rehmannia glutinosa]|uniref:Uncharacterized protein n=1 Tax=Rehmannia glutinosa TaxID=99300 RepID=A0ABR0VZ88_REHGL
MNSSGNSSFNSSTATPNFDNLLLQSLMSRLQLRPPNFQGLPPPFSAAKSLEDLLLSEMLLNLSESDSDSENDYSASSSKTQLAKEESKLEKEIEETGSDYRVWEWHGHIMLFDEENGYTPEYIYGNYFERLAQPREKMKNEATKKSSGDDDEKEKETEKVGNVGLKELIECGESGSGRILHRNINANSGSPRNRNYNAPCAIEHL